MLLYTTGAGFQSCCAFWHADIKNRQQGEASFQMLAWLAALPYLVITGPAYAAPGSNIEKALGKDVMLIALSGLKFADLCQASLVSKHFYPLVRQVATSLYGIQRVGKRYLNYTRILHEMDVLIQDAKEKVGINEVNRLLENSPHFMCIQAALRAQFGYCIRYVKGDVPTLFTGRLSFDALNCPSQVSVLPYLLDTCTFDDQNNFFMQGLADYGEFDLMAQLNFSKITYSGFYRLMGLLLPESVRGTAATAFRKNEPDSELASQLALAGFGSTPAFLAENCRLPLFILWHLHEKNASVSKFCTFFCGEASSFHRLWLSVLLEEEVGRAGELLELCFKHGDNIIQLVANMFYAPVSFANLSGLEKDICQALLIRFYFSSICNDCVVQNYTSMLKGLKISGYYIIWAFMDCKQWDLLKQCEFNHLSVEELEALLIKVGQFKDNSLDPLLRKLLKQYWYAPALLKSLIRRKADDVYVQLVWESIQSTLRCNSIQFQRCSAPLGTLRRLMSQRNISVSDAEEMLGMLDGFEAAGKKISREFLVLCTVMYWEAPENIIAHFLDLMPHNYEVGYEYVWEIIQSTEYSSALCQKFLQRCDSVDAYWQAEFEALRPDLVWPWSLTVEDGAVGAAQVDCSTTQ